jgi:signal transduction histidine kinase
MGLGLSISKSIVEKMGGIVNIESVVGQGSKFTITFIVMSKISNS